jgi:hypothetical protein
MRHLLAKPDYSDKEPQVAGERNPLSAGGGFRIACCASSKRGLPFFYVYLGDHRLLDRAGPRAR